MTKRPTEKAPKKVKVCGNCEQHLNTSCAVCIPRKPSRKISERLKNKAVRLLVAHAHILRGNFAGGNLTGTDKAILTLDEAITRARALRKSSRRKGK